jgi:UDP-N-acetylmuramoyl-tripeptide--D-alanyl-D-alanine ligase
MPENTEVCIVEMGMNHLGEISVLSNMAKPDYALITNIGESHIGLLGSRENIAKAKLEILVGLKKKENILYDGDEKLLSHLTGFPILNSSIQNITQLNDRISFEINNFVFDIPTFGTHNVKNAAFAIQIGNLLGVDIQTLQNGLRNFKNQPLRLEYKEVNSNSFLLDCYNASLTSMKSALETFYTIKTDKSKVAILGDIFELGDESIDTHKEIGKLTNLFMNTNFWFIGNDMKYAFDCNIDNDNSLYFSSKKELFSYINGNTNLLSNHYFLLKASRGMRLEEIYDYFPINYQ